MMKNCLKLLCTVALTLWFGFAVAQQLEVIELKSKQVEDVLPVLLPLVEPGGTLTGTNNQLFLRTSPGNRADIKRALAAIDKPSRRLIIRVSENREQEQGGRGGEVSGQVVLGSTRRSNVDATVWDTRSGRNERSGQMVQTVDGGQAYIQVGRSLAVPMRQAVIGPGGAIVSETVVYQDVGRGFYAAPRVNGERVTLSISQQADSANVYGRGNIDRQHISTTVSGRLGEWIELGGVGKQASGSQSGTYSRSTNDVRDNRGIWLMVEEVQ
jgi:type II secretory pathway component GspD/PulD (secretin)